MEERLRKIEERAKMLGWTCESSYDDTDNMNTGASISYTIKFITPTRWLVLEGPMAVEAAERLLSLHEDGPTIRKSKRVAEGYTIYTPEGFGELGSEARKLIGSGNVLVPGTYKIVRWDDA